MYLKSLEIVGFKSFAKKASLDFTSPITGIVGPNGSGKSNVAEAFRFVLGEQSIKSLRGKRGEDLIWNGGGEAGRANRAHVKLTFDNSRRIFSKIDFDELTVERIVHRDNTNEYLINGTQVRLKDIVELLATGHIGSSGHHIISQGEADRILSASIKERREMIEDALGLKIYEWKKRESQKKLEKTDENMKQVESLRREIAPHIKFLKKQVEKVEKAEQLRKELVSLYREYFYRQEKYIKAEKARLESEIAGPKKELAELDLALESAKKILAGSKNRDQKSEQVIALETKLRETRMEKDGIMRELGRLEGQISANKRAIEKETEKQKRDEYKTVYLKDLEKVVSDIEGLSNISDARQLFSDIVSTLKSFISSHRSQSDSGLIAEAQNEINSLNSEKSSFDERLKKAIEQENELSHKYSEIKLLIEKEKDTDREAEKDVFRIIARQNEVRSVFNNLNGHLSEIAHEEDNFKRELGDAGMSLGRDAVNYNELNMEISTPDTTIRAELKRQIEKNKIRLEDAGASGGAEVLKEYRETEERDAFLAKELGDLEKARAELLELIKDLDARIDFEFKSGILKINSEFQKYFNLMFGGGKAELTVVKEIKRRKKTDLEDLSDSLSDESADDMEDSRYVDEEGPEGLDVTVNLPRKKVKGLMMLSGGERALTSIALLFAVSQVNPPPFIILDETDAALDEANSKKYGDMIENLSKHSQLILITHNRETMSRAGVIYGVTMSGDGSSRLLSIAFDEALAVAK